MVGWGGYVGDQHKTTIDATMDGYAITEFITTSYTLSYRVGAKICDGSWHSSRSVGYAGS